MSEQTFDAARLAALRAAAEAARHRELNDAWRARANEHHEYAVAVEAELIKARDRAAADEALIAQQHVDAMIYRDERDAARAELARVTAEREALRGALSDLIFYSRQWLVVLGRIAREQEYSGGITNAELNLFQKSVDWAARATLAAAAPDAKE
jgi:hypothetical protein